VAAQYDLNFFGPTTKKHGHIKGVVTVSPSPAG